MLVNRPEDRPKVIALSVALGASVLYFVFGVIPKLTNREQPMPIATAAAERPALPPTATTTLAATAMANKPSASEGPSLLEADKSPPPVSTPDPFQTPVTRPVTGLHAIAGPDLARATAPVTPDAKTSAPTVPSLPVVLPSIELQGVMLGRPGVAVLRIGDQMAYKQEGESLGYGLILLRVTEAGIVLQQGKKHLFVEIGRALSSGGAPPTEQPSTTPVPETSAPAPTPPVEAAVEPTSPSTL